MPIGTLPKPLVMRLRKAFAHGERIETWPNITKNEKLMTRLKNADHRGNRVNWMFYPTQFYGGRVRELNVSKNYPNVGRVIIKRVHEVGSFELIRLLRRTVDYHNKMFPCPLYTLRKPVAYALNEEYVAMRKISCPNIAEIVGQRGSINGPRETDKLVTPRGIEFFEQLKKQAKDPRCTKENLINAINTAEYHTEAAFHRIHPSNMLLAGFENGKFIFVPLVDLK